MKYRRKEKMVEAFQVTKEILEEKKQPPFTVILSRVILEGDWIVKDNDGVHLLSNTEFLDQYEPVEEEEDEVVEMGNVLEITSHYTSENIKNVCVFCNTELSCCNLICVNNRSGNRFSDRFAKKAKDYPVDTWTVKKIQEMLGENYTVKLLKGKKLAVVDK